MATVAEMGLLNNAVGDLSNTLLARRKLKQQETEDTNRTALDREMMGLRGRELDINRERANKATAHEERMEGKEDAFVDFRKEFLKKQEAQAAITQLNAQHKRLQGEVDAGRMTPDQAAQQAQDAKDRLQVGGQAIWENSDFGVVGTNFQPTKVSPLMPQSWTHPETGEHFAYNPKTGNFERSSAPSAGTRVTKPDPMGGPPQISLTEKLTPAQLHAAMGEMGSGPVAGEDASPQSGAEADLMREMEQPASLRDRLRAAMPWAIAGGAKPAAAAAAPGMPASVPNPPEPVEVTGPRVAPIGQAPAKVGVTHFQSEQAARAAGKQSGDRIMLWDPSRKTYRPFQLE